MNKPITVLTKNGEAKLKAELDELKSVRRHEIAEKIKVALSFGDLSENSEYDEAKNEQGIIESRIAEIEATLAHAQIIDDVNGKTLCAASSTEKGFDMYGGNCDAAKKVGQMIAEKAKQQGITDVVFDRGGYVYHGRVAALAEGAREGGLNF